jgi:anti-sigma factor RsiW
VNAGAALALVLTIVAVYYPDSRDSVLTADHLAHIGQPVAAFSIDELRPALAQPGIDEIPIKDFKDQGYALVNGRAVQIGDVTGGALLYRANGHPISLYITPTPERTETKPSYSKALGMTVVRWRDDGRDYAVVSDLPPQQLEKFVTLACESL